MHVHTIYTHTYVNSRNDKLCEFNDILSVCGKKINNTMIIQLLKNV